MSLKYAGATEQSTAQCLRFHLLVEYINLTAQKLEEGLHLRPDS